MTKSRIRILQRMQKRIYQTIEDGDDVLYEMLGWSRSRKDLQEVLKGLRLIEQKNTSPKIVP